MERRARVRRSLPMSDQKKPNNLKTALILATVALMFFVGIFVRHIWLG
jgi:hypothetical protein